MMETQPTAPDRSGCLPLILYGSFVLILGACLLPRPIYCLYYGRDRADPNGLWVERGMTAEEVAAKYGSPHEKIRRPDGEEEWHYHTDTFGSGFTFIGVQFDRQGRVKGSWNH